ncbi:hypothetical protein FOA52_015163 [Chlamydomonas sp. UWO 241]|nr:hypothetical protein FOA52_015163 [Chlamydomonas sp. UWO 241]
MSRSQPGTQAAQQQGDGDSDVEPVAPASKRAHGSAASTPRGGEAGGSRHPRESGAGPSQPAGTGRERIEVKPSDLSELQAKITKYKQVANQKASESVQLSADEMDNLCGLIVRYMLFHNLEKQSVPVSRTALSSIVTENYKKHKQLKNLLKLAMPQAQLRLLEVFGIEMEELPDRKSAAADATTAGPSTTKPAKDGVKYYVLRSALPAPMRREVESHDPRQRTSSPRGLAWTILALIHLDSGKMDVHALPPTHTRYPQVESHDQRQRTSALRGLTWTILALIHLGGGKMTETALWEWLGGLGIERGGDGAEHRNLGKVQDEICSMCERRLLVRSKKAAGQDGVDHVLELGEAARREDAVAKMDAMIDKICAAAKARAKPGLRAGAGDNDDVIEVL